MIFGGIPVKRALVAYSEAEGRKAVLRSLMAQGCDIHVVKEGQRAWAHLLQTTYDVVVLEMRLPGINALELLRLMRRLQYRPYTVVVGDDVPPLIERVALRLGAASCHRTPDDIWSPSLIPGPRRRATGSSFLRRIRGC